MIRLLKYPLLSLLATTLMAAPFVALQLWFWKPTWLWMAGFALLGWGPLVLGLTLKLRERATRRHTFIYLGFILTNVCVYAGSLWAWHAPGVRTWGAQALAGQRITAPLVACAGDPSSDVALACCEALDPLGTHTSQDRWAQWLYKHPEQPNGCMVRSITGTSYAANVLSTMMVEKWSQTLRETPAEKEGVEDQLCEIATHMRHLDRVEGVHASTHLLTCALEASHPAAAQCCAQQLKVMSVGGNVAQSLPKGELISKTPLARRLPMLLTRLMPTLDPQQEAKRRRALEPLPFDPLSLQTWALHVTCHQLKTQTDQPLEGRMTQGVHAAGCGVDVQSFSTVRMKRVCAQLIELEDMPAQGGASWMCTRTHEDAVRTSFSEAMRGVRRAHHRGVSEHEYTPSIAERSILRGYNTSPRGGSSSAHTANDNALSIDLLRNIDRPGGNKADPFMGLLLNQTNRQARELLRGRSKIR